MVQWREVGQVNQTNFYVGRPDSVALDTLFRRYWCAKGWAHGVVSDAELAHAKMAGVMFDPANITHDNSVRLAIGMRQKLAPKAVANAFLASLSTRRLDLRSALGSYGAMLNLPAHNYEMGNGISCAVCGDYGASANFDVSVLNFERFKWGGVRHDQPTYEAFDLAWLCSRTIPEPTEGDLDIMRTMIDVLSSLPAAARPGDAEKAIADLFPSNTNERRILIGILGLAGVLIPRDLPTFWNGYPRISERKQPLNKNDWEYPAMWWRGADGVNREALNFWFPRL